MKTLLLLRHAKSSWKDTNLPDHERPLNKRGRKDALAIGMALKEKELLPQKNLASSALRVRETCEGIFLGCQSTFDTEFLDALYLAEPEDILRLLQTVPDDVERVMVSGHNPGLEGLLQELSGHIESMPTGALAFISLPITTWSQLNSTTEGELIEKILPRELREVVEEKRKVKDKPAKQAKPAAKQEARKGTKKDGKKEDEKVDQKEIKKEVKKEDKKALMKEIQHKDKKDDKKEAKKEDQKEIIKETKKGNRKGKKK